MGASIVCTKGVDEIVKVGGGSAAFWIDRYEASVWSDPAGTIQQYDNVYPNTFPKNGQITMQTNLCYAVSKKGVPPSDNLSWFQANLACLASGKRLPTGPEWLLAATGTADPGADDGAIGRCVTNAGKKRNTGVKDADNLCVSVWGAQDMIGNLWEWTAEWYAGLGSATAPVMPVMNWPGASYGEDGTWNIVSGAERGDMVVDGIPAAAFRGGSWGDGTRAGVFALALYYAPSASNPSLGFRCVLP